MLKPRVAPSEVKHKIEDAFRRAAEIDGASSRRAGDGRHREAARQRALVDEKEAAEHAAWAAPGVHTVDNRLVVAPARQRSPRAARRTEAPRLARRHDDCTGCRA